MSISTQTHTITQSPSLSMKYLVLFLGVILLASTTTSFAQTCAATNAPFLAKLRWPVPKTCLMRYYITRSGTSIPYLTRYLIFRQAFAIWTKATCIRFALTSIERIADITFTFEVRDGPSQTVATAFPPTDGRIRLDSEENWATSQSSLGPTNLDLLTVAVHEIGHALGLRHTAKPTAVMNKNFQLGERKITLDAQDISRIEELYGKCN
ncbi:hypothetical protein ZOSMA_59G00180 [Zostera marina]|uniref:Peptidase metallopeptidase domain-containing protein n=1 Tax=Zostera marina TaxID=29655 RepID=A0A0K9NUZ9_ZOSMR|nr:hypothetical protein ZOSMA_59G00180 [Zostera marina]